MLHDGRIRTTPHVDGQFAAHVYVPVRINRDILGFLKDVSKKARSIVPSLHSIPKSLDEDALDHSMELHISLSRPVYLRSHQREEFKRAVRQIAKSCNT